MAFFGGGGDSRRNIFGDMLGSRIHQHFENEMHQMDAIMSEMLGGIPTGGMFRESRGRRPTIESGHPRQQMLQNDPFMTPFGGSGFLSGGIIGSMMQQMQDMGSHPNSQMYSQSTVISVDHTGDEPKYYEATNTVNKVGNAKEVRKTERNSATGNKRMMIKHEIGDRSHAIIKDCDRRGKINEQQLFRNMNSDDAEAFDNEFMDRVSRNKRGRRKTKPARIRDIQHEAIDNGPIVTVPDDDDEEIQYVETKNRPSFHSNRLGKGPIIEEI